MLRKVVFPKRRILKKLTLLLQWFLNLRTSSWRLVSQRGVNSSPVAHLTRFSLTSRHSRWKPKRSFRFSSNASALCLLATIASSVLLPFPSSRSSAGAARSSSARCTTGSRQCSSTFSTECIRRSQSSHRITSTRAGCGLESQSTKGEVWFAVLSSLSHFAELLGCV